MEGEAVSISVGDRIPDVELRVMTADGPSVVRSTEVLGHGKVVLFAVPGAFTPTCTDYHLPGYVARAEELGAKGVDLVACVAVNDAWVLAAWAASQRVGDTVTMLADGNGDFARAMGLSLDLTGAGLGVRSQRYAAILQDGVVTSLAVEPQSGISVSGAEAVLASL